MSCSKWKVLTKETIVVNAIETIFKTLRAIEIITEMTYCSWKLFSADQLLQHDEKKKPILLIT